MDMNCRWLIIFTLLGLMTSELHAESLLSREWSSQQWRNSKYFTNKCQDFHVWYGPTQSCEPLYARGGVCGSRRWLVPRGNGSLSVCSSECLRGYQCFFYFQDPARLPSNWSCPAGMVGVPLGFGEWDCDCQFNHVFWQQDDLNQYRGECHRVFTRGPCAEGQILTAESPSNAGLCIESPCPEGQIHLSPPTPGTDTPHVAPPDTPEAACRALGDREVCASLGSEFELRLSYKFVSGLVCENVRVYADKATAPPRRVCPRGMVRRRSDGECSYEITTA